jgi:hypothetical protein
VWGPGPCGAWPPFSETTLHFTVLVRSSSGCRRGRAATIKVIYDTTVSHAQGSAREAGRGSLGVGRSARQRMRGAGRSRSTAARAAGSRCACASSRDHMGCTIDERRGT